MTSVKEMEKAQHGAFHHVCNTNVTECICTLCCCTLIVALSVFFRVWTSFNLLDNYVLRVIFDVTKRRNGRAREKARSDTNGLSQIASQKKRTNQEPLAVARLLLPILPTCYFHRPFTSGTASRTGRKDAK